MPWNCLCSTKEKRKLEISAPILNVEDFHNQQPVPLKQRLVIPSGRYVFDAKSKKHQQKHTSGHCKLDQDPTKHGFVNGNRDDFKVSGGKTLTQKGGDKQWIKDEDQEAEKSVVPIIVNFQDPEKLIKTHEKQKENAKINKQLVNVKFSFESAQDNVRIKDAGRTECQVISKRVPVYELERENHGNYDEIPFIRIEKTPNRVQASFSILEDVSRPSSLAIHQSLDTIPFIGDDNSRSFRKSFEGANNAHRSGNRVLSGDEIEHNFQFWKNPNGLCQVCHKLLNQRSVRCSSCFLVCHESCVPSIRYHDTSLIIFRKWLQAHEKLAFPTLYRYVYEESPGPMMRMDHNLTDSEITRDEQHQNSQKRKRRRTRSLEERKSHDLSSDHNHIKEPPPVVVEKKSFYGTKDDQNNNNPLINHNRIQLQIVEVDTASRLNRISSSSESEDQNSAVKDTKSSNNVDGYQKELNDTKHMDVGKTEVKVDVHRDDEGLVIKEKGEMQTKDEVPETDLRSSNETLRDSKRCSRASDLSVEELRSSTAGSDTQRAGILIMSTSSSTVEFDDDEDVIDFSKVDLRKTKSHHDDNSRTHTIPKSQSFPIRSKHQQQSDTLRLHYVTQRILSSVLPRRDHPDITTNHSEALAGSQDKYEREVITMLEQKHGKNYRLFDLESCISVITLEKLCELCKHIDSWLGSGKDKVVVLQDREDRQRLGVAIAAYLKYLDICSSSYTSRGRNEDIRVQNAITRNWLDLDVFSMKKFLEDFIGALRIPSHRRYLSYFSGLLSGKIRMNSSPLYLKYITLESPPSWLQYERLSSQNSEWSSFIKIYEGLRCVYTSDIHIIPITTRQFLYQIGNLRLRGDIMIRCYHVIEQQQEKNNFDYETRELLFSVQFHTCAISSNDVTFIREELDIACDDPRYPRDHKILLHFNKGGATENGYVFQSPLIRTEPPGELARYDSIENFDPNSSCHTQGPLDGSLYATILKSPKSPHYRSHLKNPTQVVSQRESLLTQNLISPPPQFSNNNANYEIVERQQNRSSSAPLRNSVGSTRRDEITLRPPSRSSRSDYSYVDIRPGTSQSIYKDSNNYTPIPVPGTKQITIVETFTTTDNSISGQNGARESVRSPLTLSMDSGISSSGVLNRRPQGSSVSPSPSFPSQASPQEDRHRELDDILSDMLMTVQDIPDFNKNQQKIVRSQSVIPATSSANYALPATSATIYSQHHQFGHDTVKRSHSYGPTNTNFCIVGDGNRGAGDQYDTSSTTTTLTPPASESGRDTPIIRGSGSAHLYSGSSLQREKREIYTTTTTTATAAGQHQYRQPLELMMDSQLQSTAYPRTVRTDSTVVSTASEDEENIPYHAREHSQPFSYGNVPISSNHLQIGEHGETIDPRMIKMQSGLSSPSLVRKTLSSSSQTLQHQPRKTTNACNDFEKMLRERREKVMNEKYSISDRHPSSVERSYSSSDNKWLNSVDSGHTNGYHYYHEPLKRSNTMDGGFGRSNSTDGISGQTWLQLQQQKLRAKKDQQVRDDRRYFEETIHTEIRNRPLRSRAVVPRYDGYASDTAAFADEVDYRRPLHVQTPYANRSSDRNYHTLTTTTTTVTQKERPFVAVKRAHEQAKHNNSVGSPPLSPLSVLNASPNGHISQVQTQNGLLSMADSQRSNGHRQLEFDNTENHYSLQIDNNSEACTENNVKFNRVINNHSSNSTDNSTDHNQNINNKSSNTNNNNNNRNSHSNNNHHQNNHIFNNEPNHHNFHHQNVTGADVTPSVSPVEDSEQKNSNDNAPGGAVSGHLMLDRLLALLAFERNIIDTQLEQSNGDPDDAIDQVILRRDNPNYQPSNDIVNSTLSDINSSGNSIIKGATTSALINGSNSGFNGTNNLAQNTLKDKQDLSDVIADLTEFSRCEAIRQSNSSNGNNTNGFSDSSSSNSNSINVHSTGTNGLTLRQVITESDNCSSISPSLSERSNSVMWHDQVREESFSSYRSETDPELSIAGSPRPETPAFPVTPRTPYGISNNGNVSPALPPKSPTSLRKDLYSGSQRGHLHEVINQNDTISAYTSRRNSNTSNANSEPQEVAAHHVKFVRDSSKYWYKPSITREEAVSLLRNATPGTFIVRDSTTFKNAFGLVLRVAHPPPGVQAKGPAGDELVRHFLVEPTSRGVRLKGCANEPVFTSLSALVYQHSITPLALPCRLIIPDRDIQSIETHSPAQKQLLAQGAACNVLYLFTCETESLTGEEAVRKAVSQLYTAKPLPNPTEVHFKVSSQGITMTDVSRQRFFRKHYSANIVSYCGLDPERRLWSVRAPDGEIPVNNKTIFAFVARRSAVSTDNQCHVFCDLQPNQPAQAIISFANKVLPTEKIVNHHI